MRGPAIAESARGSRGVCPQLEVALPFPTRGPIRQQGSSTGRAHATASRDGLWPSRDRDGSAQAVGHDRGDDRRRDGHRWGSVRHRFGRVRRDEALCQPDPARHRGPGLGGRGLQRHRSPHRDATACCRRAGHRRPTQDVRAGAGVLHRAGSQDRRHRRPLRRAGRHPHVRATSGGQRRTARRAAAAGRPPPLTGRGPHPDDLPAARAAAGADPWWCEEEPVRGPGQDTARDRASTRRRGQDPPPGRGRADRGPRAGLRAEEGRGQGTEGTRRRDRHQPAGPARHRTLRRCAAAGRDR